MGKAPAYQFYTGDWFKDPALQACNVSTKGIWVELVHRMWDSTPRGTVCGNATELSRLTGATRKQLSLFFDENSRRNFADVESNNGTYIISCRRMKRDELEREATRKRVQKHRSITHDVTEVKHECNAPSSSSSSSSSSKPKKHRAPVGDAYTPDFEKFWQEYPRKKEKAGAARVWGTRVKEVKPNLLTLAATRYAKEVSDKEPEYVKLGATFLGPKRPYEDYLTEDDLDPEGKVDRLQAQLTDLTDRRENIIKGRTKEQLEQWQIESANEVTRQIRTVKDELSKFGVEAK